MIESDGEIANSRERLMERLDTQVGVARMAQMQAMGVFPTSHSRPLGFQLELTSACNLSCKHCYNQSGKKSSEDLSHNEWKRVAAEILELQPFQMIFSGGEPLLLGENLFELMDMLNVDPIRFIIISNGWLATPDVVNRLVQYNYYWMQISIDGFNSVVHDEFRGARDSWVRAVDAAYQISTMGKPLVVAHTVHPNNIDSLDRMIDLAAVLGANRIICDEAMAVGRAYQERHKIMLTDAQRERMSEVIAWKQQEYNNLMDVLRTSDPANSFELYRTSPCSVLLIRPNGDVKLDCVLPFVIGNVRRQSLTEIWETIGKEAWKHPRVKKYVDSYQDSGDFISCEARPYVEEDILLEA